MKVDGSQGPPAPESSGLSLKLPSLQGTYFTSRHGRAKLADAAAGGAGFPQKSSTDLARLRDVGPWSLATKLPLWHHAATQG